MMILGPGTPFLETSRYGKPKAIITEESPEIDGTYSILCPDGRFMACGFLMDGSVPVLYLARLPFPLTNQQIVHKWGIFHGHV